VARARHDDLRAQVADPSPHGLGGHEAAHRIQLAGEKQRRLLHAAIGNRL
jgi:hypothetical protein